MRILVIIVAMLFIVTGASAAHGPLRLCLEEQKTADNCCDKTAAPVNDCSTDCCLEVGDINLDTLAAVRSPVKPIPAFLPGNISYPSSDTRVCQMTNARCLDRDPHTITTRDQNRAELQVRLN